MKKLLTIVCHLHFGYKDIRKAMMSILSQSDKNFDVICILDNINQSIKDILVEPEIDAVIKKANNISAIVVDKKLGHT